MSADDPISDVLSQNEVESLLAQVAQQEGGTVVHQISGEKVRRPHESIQPYDFRHPVFLSANELRKLRLRHEEYIRALTARMSIYLRLEFGLQMSKLNTVTYQKFMDSLPNPTHLTLFKAEPLRGVCILDVNPRLGLTIVDRLMGGAGHVQANARDLTGLEVALLDQAVEVILTEWCSHWSALQELKSVLLGHESNGRFLQTSPADTAMLVLTMEARVGDCMEQIQMGFPYYTLEPLVRRLGEELDTEANERAASGPELRWNKNFETVTVPVTAEWNNLEITARELSALKPGDVLTLDPDCLNQIRLRIAKVPKFLGTLGTVNDRWAVSVRQTLPT